MESVTTVFGLVSIDEETKSETNACMSWAGMFYVFGFMKSGTIWMVASNAFNNGLNRLNLVTARRHQT